MEMNRTRKLEGAGYVVASIALLLIGLSLEYKYCLDYFSRFGSLLVVFVVLIISLEKDHLIRLREITKTLSKNVANSSFETEIKSTVDPEYVENIKVSKLTNNLDKAVEYSVSRIYKIEISIGVLGTLVWGFGDLLVNFENCVA